MYTVAFRVLGLRQQICKMFWAVPPANEMNSSKLDRKAKDWFRLVAIVLHKMCPVAMNAQCGQRDSPHCKAT